jgi:hypothetical protein
MVQLHLSAPGTVLDRAEVTLYDGSFELDILAAGEVVRSAGDDTGACEVVTPEGVLRFDVGDWIVRSADGRLARTSYDLTTLARVND